MHIYTVYMYDHCRHFLMPISLYISDYITQIYKYKLENVNSRKSVHATYEKLMHQSTVKCHNKNQLHNAYNTFGELCDIDYETI